MGVSPVLIGGQDARPTSIVGCVSDSVTHPTIPNFVQKSNSSPIYTMLFTNIYQYLSEIAVCVINLRICSRTSMRILPRWFCPVLSTPQPQK